MRNFRQKEREKAARAAERERQNEWRDRISEGLKKIHFKLTDGRDGLARCDECKAVVDHEDADEHHKWHKSLFVKEVVG